MHIVSDIIIHYNGGQIFGHKIVLSVRSAAWSERPLSEVQRLDIFEFREDVVRCLFQWIYKDVVELPNDDDDEFTLQLVAAANRYQLISLKEK